MHAHIVEGYFGPRTMFRVNRHQPVEWMTDEIYPDLVVTTQDGLPILIGQNLLTSVQSVADPSLKEDVVKLAVLMTMVRHNSGGSSESALTLPCRV